MAVGHPAPACPAERWAHYDSAAKASAVVPTGKVRP
jgi:L-fucose mutarotase/ribose pyranase (RbsD/FucU family)